MACVLSQFFEFFLGGSLVFCFGMNQRGIWDPGVKMQIGAKNGHTFQFPNLGNGVGGGHVEFTVCVLQCDHSVRVCVQNPCWSIEKG